LFEIDGECKYWVDDGDYSFRCKKSDIDSHHNTEGDAFNFIIERVSPFDVALDSLNDVFIELNSMFDFDNSKEHRHIKRLSDDLNLRLNYRYICCQSYK